MNNEQINAVILTIVSIIIGSFFTWLFSWKYYIKAGKELVKETEELRRLNLLLMRGLENAGLLKIDRDSSGNPIGLVINVSGNSVTHVTASCDSIVVKKN